MPTIVNSPFKSKFGFESTGFLVDDEGNITAKSISLQIEDPIIPDTNLPADRIILEVDGNFRVSGNATDNPTLNLFRNRTTTIDLNLDTLTFNIFTDNNFDTLYSNGLTHDDGDLGIAAQGKNTGRIAWNVSLTAPDTLYYANADGTIFGIIQISNPPSAFSEVQVTNTTASTSSTTGALTVAGGLGVAGDLYVGGSLNIDGVGITSISSSTNLELNATNKIVLQIENIKIGELNSLGLAVTINNSTIDNTVIGATIPATATFTSALVTEVTNTDNSITNKAYVDSTVTALAIALGS